MHVEQICVPTRSSAVKCFFGGLLLKVASKIAHHPLERFRCHPVHPTKI